MEVKFEAEQNSVALKWFPKFCGGGMSCQQICAASANGNKIMRVSRLRSKAAATQGPLSRNHDIRIWEF